MENENLLLNALNIGVLLLEKGFENTSENI